MRILFFRKLNIFVEVGIKFYVCGFRNCLCQDRFGLAFFCCCSKNLLKPKTKRILQYMLVITDAIAIAIAVVVVG